ncbi:NADH-ubiquinone oxidoreductase chain 1 [Entophlyctis sp. JEL0112]|nr:NADH-ubiquinone oxidoreductase chain 1 [Entophlyctis sp. JEL0112]
MQKDRPLLRSNLPRASVSLGGGAAPSNIPSSRGPSPTSSVLLPRSGSSLSFTGSVSGGGPALSRTSTIGKDNVVVCVRMRPTSDVEIDQRLKEAWIVNEIDSKVSMEDDVADKLRRTGGVSGVTDFVYGVPFLPLNYCDSNIRICHTDIVQTGSDNKDLYDMTAQNTVWAAMEGMNGTVFAYGQTASGKTYTMMGTEEQPGVIPQAIDDVFSYIREQTEEREYLLRVNETIRDLLNPSQQDLRIHEDRKRGVYVSPLKEEIVTTPKQCMKVIQRGEAARSYGSTEYNERSSRSHTIFQMVIESRDKNSGVMMGDSVSSQGPPGGGVPLPSKTTTAKVRGSVTISTLSLIDLAGSEKAAINADRRKEGSFINKSLLTLGNVISRLTADDAKSNTVHVPYRDSKLTRILQSSLSGNARVSVIATVSPTTATVEETSNTLKFAERIKKVQIRARQNQVLDEKALIQKYKIEIAELRNKLMETNDLLEKERAMQEFSVSNASGLAAERKLRIQFEEQLHEAQLVRTALKERIDHLTKLILSSSSVTPKAILDWNAPYDSGDKRTTVMVEGLMPSQNFNPSRPTVFNRPAGTAVTTATTAAARKTQRLSRQMSDKDFLHRHIAELDSRDEKITRYESLVSALRGCKSVAEVTQLLSAFSTDSEKAVASVDEIKEEVYRLRKRTEEMEIVINEQNEKLELYEASGSPVSGGAVAAFEESPRYKEMSVLIMQLRMGLDERDGIVKGLKAQVTELRSSVRDLELREFEHLEALAMAATKNRTSVSSLEDFEGKMSARLKEAEANLDAEVKARAGEKEDSEKTIASLKNELGNLKGRNVVNLHA